MVGRAHASGMPATRGRAKRSSLNMDSSSRKRRRAETPTRSRSPLVHNVNAVKVPLATHSPSTTPGLLLVFGAGDTGQLGLGPDITVRSRPARHSQTHLESLNLTESQAESFFTQVCAGGMHTVGLTTTGRVITCGCNDEGALGRKTSSDSDSLSEVSPPAAKRAHVETSEANEPLEVDKMVEETRLAYVPLPLSVKITMVSAGDSHTAALDSNGQVWLWGAFRDSSGPIGLTEAGVINFTPEPLLVTPSVNGPPQNGPDSRTSSSGNGTHLNIASRVVKIASGQDHLVCLTDEGRLYTMGCGEQGQLGRIAERFARTGGRSGKNALLQPAECRVRGAVRFSDAWAGGYATFARCQSTGQIYACGLNNYGQLALLPPRRSSRPSTSHESNEASELREEEEDTVMEEDDAGDENSLIDAARVITDRDAADKSEATLIARQGPLIQFMLTRARGFSPEKDWKQFAISMHHTLALDKAGHVYAVGRPHYGRLGLGAAVASGNLSISVPTRVQGALTNCVCTWIGVGESCSYAVDSSGTAYSWGMGSNQQLGHGDDDDDCLEPVAIKGKQLQDRRVSMVDAGGQHAVMLVHPSQSNAAATSVEDVTMYEAKPGPDSTEKKDSSNQNKGSNDNTSNTENTGVDHAPSATLHPCPPPPPPTTELVEIPSKLNERSNLVADLATAPILVAPVGGVARRTWRVSPSSAAIAILAGVDSAAPSTAGATVNSSVHSSAISDTSSVGSCASNASTSSQLNSAKSTDGGGSSRCSSFDTYSIQSSLPLMAAMEDASGPPAGVGNSASGGGGSRMLDPLSASLLANSRTVGTLNRSGNSNVSLTNSARVRSAGMSICSTSSEPGIPTDTISLGSLTASPADLMSGEQSNG